MQLASLLETVQASIAQAGGLGLQGAFVYIVTYELNNTHTVWLVEGHRSRRPGSVVLACEREVNCDTLKGVSEAVYDQAIRDHNNGFIPLS
ncbi:MAG: hypothetical protein M5U12_32755 [Verrucomicrobia bacterium]|nr:hypothetical protein [Verrucomicrobiota bacterium]